MRTIFSEKHALHSGTREIVDDKLVPSFESPERASLVLDAVVAAGLGDVVPPDDFDSGPLERVHDRRYLEFLETAWDQWTAAGRSGNARPNALRAPAGWNTSLPTPIIDPGWDDRPAAEPV